MANFRPFSVTPKLSVQVTADPASINDAAFGDTSLTVPGFKTDMIPLVHAPALESGLIISGAKCTTNGTVVIRIHNTSGGVVNPASQAFNVIGL